MMTENDKFEIRNSKFEISKKGFTLIEVLTAVVIIAILVGILVPALNMVKKIARDTQQKAQLASIEIGLNMYKNESCFGDYPPSHGYSTNYNYCGAQTLAEAMLGQDLLGVDPNTRYDVGAPYAPEYTYGNSAYDPNNRKGPYLDRTHINVFTADDVYGTRSTAIEKDLYLISDVYSVKKLKKRNRSYNVGTPILYYKANTSKTAISDVYEWQDNSDLIEMKSVMGDTDHFMTDTLFFEMITDPMLTNRPVRPDSFLLISAGNDGLYGTSDDICNFEPNIE